MNSRTSLLLCAFSSALAGAGYAAEKPPNILVAVADDWGLHAGAYGTRWVKTPAFDRVAREGLLFNRAYTPNAKCAPSRACLLTGRNSWQLKDAANHICYFPAEFKSWGEVLADNGWFVGHTQKGWGPGVAKDANGKDRLMTGIAFDEKKAKPPTSGISNNDYAANFQAFLEAAPPGKPWCFWYGSVEPHRGYEFGSGVAKGGKQISDIDRVPEYWPDNDTVRHDMLDYAFEVEHFDRYLGRMIAELKKRGEVDSTLILVTSDHGMPFPRVKGNAYENANHIPMAMRWPRGIAKPGRVIDDFVSFIDVAPTLLELAGLPQEKSGMAPIEGRSLTDIFKGEKSSLVNPARDRVLLGKERTDIGRPHDWGYPTRAIIQGDWMYVKNYAPERWPAGNPETGYLDCDGGATKTVILEAHRANSDDRYWALCFGLRPGEELYNLAKDPDCVQNLAGIEGHLELQNRLREQMESELRRQGDPRMEGRGHIFDEYPHANPANAGFYERFVRGEKLNTGWVNDSDFEKAPTKK